jgi:hypothetical protein
LAAGFARPAALRAADSPAGRMPNARFSTVQLKISSVYFSTMLHSGAEAGERNGTSEFQTITYKLCGENFSRSARLAAGFARPAALRAVDSPAANRQTRVLYRDSEKSAAFIFQPCCIPAQKRVKETERLIPINALNPLSGTPALSCNIRCQSAPLHNYPQ